MRERNASGSDVRPRGGFETGAKNRSAAGAAKGVKDRAAGTFTERVIRIILGIPEGKVMTYGQIAACAGNPRGARQVVRILHSMSEKHHLPWHRVINAKGEIGLPEGIHREMQLQELEAEGVTVTAGGKVDLAHYRHEPELESCGEP